jgi:hypothetical protein
VVAVNILVLEYKDTVPVMHVWRFASKGGSHKSKERKERATHAASMKEMKISNNILVENSGETERERPLWGVIALIINY